MASPRLATVAVSSLLTEPGGIKYQFGNAIFQPVKVKGVAFVKHVSLLNLQGDLSYQMHPSVYFVLKNMQKNIKGNADLITLGRNHALDERCAKMWRLKVKKQKGKMNHWPRSIKNHIATLVANGFRDALARFQAGCVTLFTGELSNVFSTIIPSIRLRSEPAIQSVGAGNSGAKLLAAGGWRE